MDGIPTEKYTPARKKIRNSFGLRSPKFPYPSI